MRSLFQIDLSRTSAQKALEYNLHSFELSQGEESFARRLVEGALAHRAEIDALIHRSATHWRVERMARTDRNILRMAIYELLYEQDVPASVTVNEAVELAKVYGDTDSGKFVNGVLGQVLRESTAT